MERGRGFMNPEDEHPKPKNGEKFTRAGRWKVPGSNPNPPELPTAPFMAPPTPESDLPAGFKPAPQPSSPPAAPAPPKQGPGEFTRMFQSPAQKGDPNLPPKLVPSPRLEAAPPVPAPHPPAPQPQQGPGEFTRLFQAPPVPPGARPKSPAAASPLRHPAAEP